MAAAESLSAVLISPSDYRIVAVDVVKLNIPDETNLPTLSKNPCCQQTQKDTYDCADSMRKVSIPVRERKSSPTQNRQTGTTWFAMDSHSDAPTPNLATQELHVTSCVSRVDAFDLRWLMPMIQFMLTTFIVTMRTNAVRIPRQFILRVRIMALR
jgi:hypothetical protein